MSVVKDRPRVAYVVSGDLVRFADLLPSNEGRSSLVHSLAYHLDLLDLSALNDGDRGIKTSEKTKLLDAIFADLSPAATTHKELSRATVHLPHPATHQQLTSYHQESFLKQLAKSSSAVSLDNSSKRRKLDSSLESSDSGSSSEIESDEEASDHTSSSEELHRRPSSTVSGLSNKRPRARNQFGLQDDCPAFDGLHRHISLVAGASITAAELLATGQADIAIAWDGGRHHAKKDAASGFCYINDVVLAILALRKPSKVAVTTTIPRNFSTEGDDEENEEGEGKETIRKTTIKRVDRVLYLDLDLHWGDGVQEAFHTSPNVLTLSIHHYAPGFFPCYAPSSDPDRFGPPGSLKGDTGAGSKTLNIPLAVGTSDSSLNRVIESTVQSLVQAWHPEVVVVQCGVDGLAGDPMAVWNLSAAAYVKTMQSVLSWKKPTLLLGGGGYNSENAARCWSLLTAVCLGRFEDRAHAKRHAAKPLHEEPTPLTEQHKTQEDGDEQGKPASTDKISFDTAIPDHKFWPNYAPEYTLDVPAGEMIDQNDEAHFEVINKTFLEHVKAIASLQHSK